jgi:hypothetical protein
LEEAEPLEKQSSSARRAHLDCYNTDLAPHAVGLCECESPWCRFLGDGRDRNGFTGHLISSWRENYIRYGYVWHALQCERYRYLTHATEEYSDSDEEKAARNFASRVEQLVMAEVTDWQALMERVEQENRNGGPAGSQGN